MRSKIRFHPRNAGQVALEVALASRKPEGQRETRNDSVSAVHPYEKEMPSAEEGMSEEARYYWYLQTIAGAVALQELDSIPTDKLNEMMAHIAAFKAKHPEKAEHILKRIKKLVAGL